MPGVRTTLGKIIHFQGSPVCLDGEQWIVYYSRKGTAKEGDGKKGDREVLSHSPLSFNSLTANRFQGCIADAKAMVHAKAMVCAASETWEVVDHFSRAILICHGEANLWAGRM